MERIITEELLEQYRKYLVAEEKGEATVEKYMRDLGKLAAFVGDRELNKELILSYKKRLMEKNYKTSSVNSFLVAMNCFFAFLGWHDLRVKTLKVQREAFRPEDKCLTRAEYKRLVRTAMEKNKKRLALILQTICATGIRVSELSFITVEAVGKGETEIRCKGKSRTVLIPRKLRKILKKYIKDVGIRSGAVFQTSGGKPVDRSNIWREMKALCKEAGVDEKKVFPHNLRHLFARCFYEIKKDLANLADILGHGSIETTRIYTRGSSREHGEVLERMGLVLEM